MKTDVITSEGSLFAWPKQSEFGRKLNKERFYAGTRSNRKLKRLFTEQVAKITWQYKLAALTLNIPPTPEVPEIEVIQIEATTEDLDSAVLLAIDRQVPNPTIHEIRFGTRIRQMAAYKRVSEADKKAVVVGHYVSTGWFSKDQPRTPLPVSLDLGKMYAGVLRGMIDIPVRHQENLREHVDRHAQVLAAKREAERIEKKMNAEKQLNRKVEWNAQLRSINQKIHQLSQANTQEADA